MVRMRGTVCWYLLIFVFFFQAEDGIRDSSVTGVQTCALPICPGACRRHRSTLGTTRRAVGRTHDHGARAAGHPRDGRQDPWPRGRRRRPRRHAAAAALSGCQAGLRGMTPIPDRGLAIADSEVGRPIRLLKSAIRGFAVGLLISCGGGGPPAGDANTVVVIIPRGATLDAAIDSLAAHDVIRSPCLLPPYPRAPAPRTRLTSA